MVRKVSTRWRRLLKTAGVLCALVAGALAFPTAARASCGDYVTVHPPQQDGSYGESRPSAPAPHPDRQPKPCSGPSCSGHPLPNPPPPESSPNTFGERWADLASTLPPLECPRAALAPVGRTAGLACPPSDIYHPPR